MQSRCMTTEADVGPLPILVVACYGTVHMIGLLRKGDPPSWGR